MLFRLSFTLFFVVLLFGVSGFILNSTEAGPHDLYKSMIGDQGIPAPESTAQKKVRSNRENTRDYFAGVRAQQDRLRNQMRDLRAKILGVRDADKTRRQDADLKINTLNQSNEDNIRRQKDRIRDLQHMSRDRMSSLRNQR